MLNIPFVQQKVSAWVAAELSETLGSRLAVGRIDVGLLNRIIINDLQLEDPQGNEIAKVSRLSAKFDILPLLEGKISISNVQFFGFNVRLERETPEAPLNCQFVIDALASKDSLSKKSNINLRINSLLIRRGRMSYDVLSEDSTPGRFNAGHISLRDIAADISLKTLQSDSVNAIIKRLNVEEENSGFSVKKLGLRLKAGKKLASIENFRIELPHSTLQTDTILVRYDSLEMLGKSPGDLLFHFHLLPSRLVLQDLSAFVPAFRPFREALEMEVKAEGRPDQIRIPLLSVAADEHFILQGDFSLQDLSHLRNAYIAGNISRLRATSKGTDFFVRNFSREYTGTPPMLQHLGTVSFNGQVSGYLNDLVMFGQVQTDIGSLRSDLKLSLLSEDNAASYSGTIETSEFDLGRLSGNPLWGCTSLKIAINGKHAPHRYPAISVEGNIAALQYCKHLYENIGLNGEYRQGGFSGLVTLNDADADIRIEGDINVVQRIPSCKLRASVGHFRPNRLNLTSRYQEDTEIDFRINADFTGRSIDEMNGEVSIDSLSFRQADMNLFMESLKIKADSRDERYRKLSVHSDFLRGKIEGDYSYRTLPASLQGIMYHYLPALFVSEPPLPLEKSRNNFEFQFHLLDTRLLSSLLEIPLTVYTHSTLQGYFNDTSRRVRIEGYFPRVSYGDHFLESGMLLCETSGDAIRSRVRFSKRKEKDAVNVSVEAEAKDDHLTANINWGNNSTVTYSGRLNAAAHFIRENLEEEHATRRQKETGQRRALKAVIDIHPTDVILNDTVWQVHPSQVVVDSGKIHVRDFCFSQRERHLRINGTLSEHAEDTIYMDLNRINVGYVFDIAQLNVNFNGEATGKAYAYNVLKEPFMSTDLHFLNFGLNDGLLGEADIHGEWHHQVKGIHLDADIREDSTAHTVVHGYVYPLKPTSSLDLQIQAQNTNLRFIHHYIQSVTSDFNGRVTGDVHFYGRFKELTLQGKVLADASMKIDALNTTYRVRDSIRIEPEGLTFPGNTMLDSRGHTGRMEGYLRYNHFRNARYRLNFNMNNMLIMDTRESPSFPFYGTIYATGHATIQGNPRDGLSIDAAISSNRNSTFTYIKDYVSSATSNQFIQFVDRTPRRRALDMAEDAYEQARKAVQEQETDMDIRLNLLLNATPDATVKIIMDPVAGDYISGRGSGDIRTEFYNKGDIRMFGNYRLNQGVYKFSLQEVIRKDFIIQDGSSISFNGAPLNATLGIKATYMVTSASLNDLMPNASEYVNQTNVKVNCIMDLTGRLTAPTIQLGIELPNERDEVQALVRNYIPTDEQMNMQILYLLALGKFYTPENVDVNQNSNMMSSVLSSTISGQLNNVLSHIIDNNNWNIGTNLSTGEKGWTDVEVEGILSGQLLNNRLQINGNFGYRDTPMSNTNFVGDFDAEWLVTRSGDIRLKAYNETNDRYYTKTNLTTQGIGIIFRKDFNKWKELLFWNNWKLKRLQKREEEREERERKEQQ